MTPTPFETALGDAQDAIEGYVTTATPIIAAVAVLFLGIKYLKRFVRGL